MTRARRYLLLGLTGLLAPAAAHGACCYFSAKDQDVLQPSQKAFITFDEKENVETFTVQPRFEAVLEFLGSLVLYQTDRLPCDIDGDGRISESFLVQGMDTGCERFQPEWLFRIPGRIEGPITNVQGERVVSFAITNVSASHGLDLEYLRDRDRDGFPDVTDPEPERTGYRDGVR
ncbi:MAG TPA: hypothetical protein VMT52_01600 [Planctomycetota bacterium]|nr:hypothetical protein [Planctomycetota bacterium]